MTDRQHLDRRRVPDPRAVGPVSLTDIVRFAGAGGDFNRLHHDADFAREAGFDRPIAMGQLSAGYLAAWLTDWCGVEHLRTLSIRFTSPVAVGEELTLAGIVDEVVDGVVHLDVSATCGDRPVLTGRATVAVPG